MIRQATIDDSMSLAALSLQVWLHTYATQGIRKEIANFALEKFTVQYFESIAANPSYKILVFIKEHHLVGYIMVNLESIWQDKSNGYEIDKLYVQEHFQGKGVGRNLISEMALRYGETCWLSTWLHNDQALGFYKYLGFIDIGKRFFELGNEIYENRVLAYKQR